MRLIDADLLTDGEGVFSKYIHMDLERSPYVTVGDLIKVIDNMPTAFDLESVIEKIKKNSQDIAIIYPTDQGYEHEYTKGIDIDKAENILKSAANSTN